MRAVMLSEFGAPEVLVAADVPEPVTGAGQILIDVEYANITFVETQVRAGKPPRPEMLPPLPAILGGGVGGVVAGTGPGVEADLLDRRVVASLGGSGGYAERAATDVSRLIEVPEVVTMRDAVALLADGRTAIGLLRRADPHPGETVLVEAAAGGVGTLLVQLARNAGARVIALAGGERKLDVARELGAEIAVDYRLPNWPERVRESAHAVDVVFDGVGGAIGQAAFELLGPGGRFCPFGMASGRFAAVSMQAPATAGATVLRGPPRGAPAELDALTRAALAEAELGRLRAVVGQEFELEHAAEAHAAIEARATIGKTLLVV
jgi:NADPH2:quinone reductase